MTNQKLSEWNNKIFVCLISLSLILVFIFFLIVNGDGIFNTYELILFILIIVLYLILAAFLFNESVGE